MRVALALAVASVISLGSSAQAQERVRISVNGGTQLGSQMVRQDFDVPINLEVAPIGADIDLSGGGLFDVGFSYHLTRGLWAGVAFSSLSRTTEAAVSAQIPHPLYFNRPRTISGTVNDVKSTEKDLHISVSYVIPISEKLDVAIFGGPTMFFIEQDMIADIDYDESYPYDTATFTDATLNRVSESSWGFNLGADITWKLSEMFGVGGLIRFTRGSTTLSVDPGNEASFDAGGTQVGGGLRIRF